MSSGISGRTVTLESEIRIREQVLFRELDHESVLLEIDSGRYFGLDEVGTRIWSLLSESHRPAVVLDRLVEEFDAPPARIENDLLVLLGELAEERLIEIA